MLSLRYSFYNEVEKHLVKLVVELVLISIEHIRLSDLYLVVVARGLISRYDTRIALGSYCSERIGILIYCKVQGIYY